MAKDRANNPARKPDIEDVRSAYFSGKLTTEEANDLADSKGRFARSVRPLFGDSFHPYNTRASNQPPSDFALDHEAKNAHRRAGLSD